MNMMFLVLSFLFVFAQAELDFEREEQCQYGGFPELVGNGICNDENNNEKCNWDGGDCCGDEVNKDHCIHCKW